MTLRSTALGGAALAGLLILAAPVSAQRSPYDTNPTPYERTQTNDLNTNAANNARGAADDSDAVNAANAANHADYNADRDRYNDQLDRYDAQRAAYDRDRAHYMHDNGGDARRWDAFYGHTRFRDVVDVPERDLMGLQVSTRGGNVIGRIRDVDSNSHGRIARIAVSTGGDRVSWIGADDVRYDPSTRAVLTDLSRDQIDRMARMRYPRF